MAMRNPPVSKGNPTVETAFNEAALKYRERVAVENYVGPGLVPLGFTFAELHACVIDAGARLRGRLSSGVPEVAIVLCVSEGPEMVALMLACAYESVYFVPCELAKTPPMRMAFVGRDCEAAAFVAWRRDLRQCPAEFRGIAAEDLLEGHFGIPSWPMNSEAQVGWTVGASRRVPTAETALYAIYTSGSMGSPKGVVVEHRHMLAFAYLKGADEGMDRIGCRVLLASTFTFDLCEGDVFAGLLFGATLVAPPRDALLADLGQVCAITRATHLTLTPSLFSVLDGGRDVAFTALSSAPTALSPSSTALSPSSTAVSPALPAIPAMGPPTARLGPDDFPSLRCLSLGGEPMTRATIARWASPPCELRNIYGATEATVHQARAVMRPSSEPQLIGQAIGKAEADAAAAATEAGAPVGGEVAPARLYLVSGWDAATGEPLLSEEHGEVVVGGPTVARGYLNRPELTAEKFIDSPTLGRLYRTGDLARSVEVDGGRALHLVGRMGGEEGLVKVNGQRVEVGEVEAALCASPLVRDAVVFLPTAPPPTLPSPSSASSPALASASEVAPSSPSSPSLGLLGYSASASASSLAPGSGGGGGGALAAVLVLADPLGEPLDEAAVSALRALAAARLPGHMVPARFAAVSALPLTGSGKTDRRTLARWFDAAEARARRWRSQSRKGHVGSVEGAVREESRPAMGDDDGGDDGGLRLLERGEFEAPATRHEAVVAAVWEETLGLPSGSVGRTDSFSLLGGDSLSALRASRLLQARTAAASLPRRSGWSEGGGGPKGDDGEWARHEEQGIALGEAAVVVHAVGSRAGERACLFGVTLGPTAPCELEERPLLADYAHFLHASGVLLADGGGPSAEGGGGGAALPTDMGARSGSLLAATRASASAGGALADPLFSPLERAATVAALQGRPRLLETVLAALERSAAPALQPGRFSPLHAAASSTHPKAGECLAMLLEKSPWAAAGPTSAGTTPLHLCAARGDAAGLRALLASPYRTGRRCSTAKGVGGAGGVGEGSAMAEGERSPVDDEVSAVDADGQTALILAARSGGVDALRVLLQASTGRLGKASVLERRDVWGRTALSWAALNGHRCILDVLLEAGADPASSLLVGALGGVMSGDASGVGKSGDSDDSGEEGGEGGGGGGGHGGEGGGNACSATREADSGLSEPSAGNQRAARGAGYKPIEKRPRLGVGSGDPRHRARKLASDKDTLSLLVAVIRRFLDSPFPAVLRAHGLSTNHGSSESGRTHHRGHRERGPVEGSGGRGGRGDRDLGEASDGLRQATEAAAALRALVCTSNRNREAARELGAIEALVGLLEI